MSDKFQNVEDKAAATPTLPRECRQLRDSINELMAALKSGDKQTVAAAVETLERDRGRAQKAMLLLGAQSGPMAHIQAFSDTLNDALETRARGLSVITGLGTSRG